MKNTIYLLIMFFAVAFLPSCKDMSDVYKEFVIEGGLTYPQKADSLKVLSGYNKLRLTWFKAKDPSVVRAEIYWNNYLDTIHVDLSDVQDEIFTMDIEDLPEGNYTFYVKTFDKYGNSSILVEATGTPYGENYVRQLVDRSIVEALRSEEGECSIQWDVKTQDLAYCEVRYPNSAGETQLIKVMPDDSFTRLPDCKFGEPAEFRSVFLPDKGIDEVVRDWDKCYFLYKFPRNGWTAVARNGHHDWGDGGGGQEALLFDGNVATGWHSTVGSAFPQCVAIDFQESLKFNYITITLPSPVAWRYIKDVEVYLSDSAFDPAQVDTFTASMTPAATATYPGNPELFYIYMPNTMTARYMALVFPTSTSEYISFMELYVFQ